MTAAGLVLAVVTVTGCTHNAPTEAGADAPSPAVTGPPSVATSGAAEPASSGPVASAGPALSEMPKALAPIPGVTLLAATGALTTRWHAKAKETTVGAPQVYLTVPYPGDGKATLDVWIGKGDGGAVPGIACHRVRKGGSPAGPKTPGELSGYCLRGVVSTAMLADITAWARQAEPRPEQGRPWKVARHRFIGYTVSMVEDSTDVGLFLKGGVAFTFGA